MLSRFRLSSTSKAAAAVTPLLISLTACQHTKTYSPSTSEAGGTNPPPRGPYSKTYGPEIKAIMALANQGRWEEAQAKATALHEEAPKNPIVERVYTWVLQTGQQRRQQALENEI